MKKLLSILAAVGLTATASSAVVACTTTIKASKVTFDAEGNATFETSKTKLDKGLKLEDSYDKDFAETTDPSKIAFYEVDWTTYNLLETDKSLKELGDIDFALGDTDDSDSIKNANADFYVSKGDIEVSTTEDGTTVAKDKSVKLTVRVPAETFDSNIKGTTVTWEIIRVRQRPSEKKLAIINKVKINVPNNK